MLSVRGALRDPRRVAFCAFSVSGCEGDQNKGWPDVLIESYFYTDLGRQRKSQPEIEEEIDIDFMRAIELSLLQHSTPANQRSRQSSSSSSSASSNRDQAQGAQTPQDLAVLSAVDGASLQKAIELSLQDSTVGGSDVFCCLNITLSTNFSLNYHIQSQATCTAS